MSARIEIQGEFVKVQEERDESYMILHIGDLTRDERIKLAAWALQEEGF
jgi:hypothetical protein